MALDDQELVREVEWLRDTLVAAATHAVKIPDVNDEYRIRYARVAADLARRGIKNPLLYGDLWDWWTRCSSGDLPTYRSRREIIAETLSPFIDRFRAGNLEPFEPTGWARVDRTVEETRLRLAAARNEEQFQAVGLLCREVLISLAVAVYNRERHPPLDGIEPAHADANRKLQAFIAVEFAGDANEDARRHARSALQLAVALQHRRTADFRMAAMCVEASCAVVNIVAIMAGRRDPQ